MAGDASAPVVPLPIAVGAPARPSPLHAPLRGLWRAIPARLRGPALGLAVGLAYLALAQFVIWLNDPVNAGAGLWPAAGLTLGALMLVPGRLWPWVLAGAAAAEFGGDLAHGYPLWVSVGWSVANTAEPLVAALLLRRFGDRWGALTPARNLILFGAFALVAGPVVGATIGAPATVMGIGGSLYDVWPKWMVGDALGVLVVAPVLLSLRERRPRRGWPEVAALAAGTLAVAVMVFAWPAGGITRTMAYLLIPFFMWAALRHGVRGTAWLSQAVTLNANAFTATGEGPIFRADAPSEHAVTLLQVFLAVTVASALLVAALVSELSDRRDVEAALRHRASHDVLTGLPNRSLLPGVLERALAGGGPAVALLVCDIDHLKSVNDTLGHRAGDALLATVADRLRAGVREGDLVTRISGDEFVVVVRGVEEDRLEALCTDLIARVARPVALSDNGEVTPSLSIGAAVGAPGLTADDLFTGADTALYEAKKLGRGRTVLFDDCLRRHAADRIALQADLPGAIASGQVRCEFQPEIELATGALFGVEALARWDHPTRGLVMPGSFVPLAEVTGNAGRLFETVLDQTLRSQGDWLAATGTRPQVAVNLSPQQLADPGLPAAVARALVRAGAPAESLWLELTESAASDESAPATLRALADLGVHLALDDFGTGWSSMARLTDHPWELVKLDRSFIAPIARDHGAVHVVRAMIVMAHALGIRVVAEGVEDADQLDILRDLGCDIAQGFLFSRSLRADDLPALLDAGADWCGPGGPLVGPLAV
ncbi:MAG: EAL domain-containing protein [Miltoncostaeaceae bacterium]